MGTSAGGGCCDVWPLCRHMAPTAYLRQTPALMKLLFLFSFINVDPKHNLALMYFKDIHVSCKENIFLLMSLYQFVKRLCFKSLLCILCIFVYA